MIPPGPKICNPLHYTHIAMFLFRQNSSNSREKPKVNNFFDIFVTLFNSAWKAKLLARGPNFSFWIFFSPKIFKVDLGSDTGSTLNFELYFFEIKWDLQVNGKIIIKFLLCESIVLLILNQSPRGRIFRFRNLFLITLKREKNSSTSFWVDPKT